MTKFTIRMRFNTGRMIVSDNHSVKLNVKLPVLTCKPDPGVLLFPWFSFHASPETSVTSGWEVTSSWPEMVLASSPSHGWAIIGALEMISDSSSPLPSSSRQYSQSDDLQEEDQLTEDEPDINDLDVGDWRKPLHHPDEDGGQHQHVKMLKNYYGQYQQHDSLAL